MIHSFLDIKRRLAGARLDGFQRRESYRKNNLDGSMVSYASLQSSIESAVDDYESYKAQSLRINFDTLSLGAPSPTAKTITPLSATHSKRASLSIPGLARLGSKETIDRPRNARTISADRSSTNGSRPRNQRMESNDSLRGVSTAKGEFRAFITAARDHEYATYSIDLEFLAVILDFIRSEHPYTSNSLKTSIKQRQMQKKKLWTRYTTQMQGLAKSYTSGSTLPAPSPFDAASSSGSSGSAETKTRVKECHLLLTKLEPRERTCGESLLSALQHFHAQAIKDIDARYSMPDPIHDKTTPVEKHNERVRVFNQLVRFVAEDLGRIERDVRVNGNSGAAASLSSKKDKKGSGAVDAVESLCVEDYPPYK